MRLIQDTEQEQAKRTVATVKLIRAKLPISEAMVNAVMRADTAYEMDLLIKCMVKEQTTYALHPPATKDVPRPVPAGRPEDV